MARIKMKKMQTNYLATKHDCRYQNTSLKAFHLGARYCDAFIM